MSKKTNAKVEEIVEDTVITDNVMSGNKVNVIAKEELVQNVNVANVANTANTTEQKPKKAKKSSLWNKIKNSKIVRAVKYAFKIKVVLQLPEAMLPEGNSNGENK